MRDRPFIAGGESPRPYSEVRAERDAGGLRDRLLGEIARLESGAAEAVDERERKQLLCEAEDLRCALKGC